MEDIEDVLDECLQLAKRFGDGEAAIAFKERKTQYVVTAYFDLTPGRLGFIASAQAPTKSGAIMTLRDDLVQRWKLFEEKQDGRSTVS